MTVTEFNSRYDAIENLLTGFAMKLTRNKDLANDLKQETVMRAFDNRDRFRSGTNFKAWVTTIMRNSFINDYRKQKTRNRVEQPVEDITYLASNSMKSEEASSNIMMQELTTIVDSLADAYRIPFTMFYRGYSYLEIAEKVQLPIGTVKSRIFFARKQLKEKITARYEGNALESI